MRKSKMTSVQGYKFSGSQAIIPPRARSARNMIPLEDESDLTSLDEDERSLLEESRSRQEKPRTRTRKERVRNQEEHKRHVTLIKTMSAVPAKPARRRREYAVSGDGLSTAEKFEQQQEKEKKERESIRD